MKLLQIFTVACMKCTRFTVNSAVLLIISSDLQSQMLVMKFHQAIYNVRKQHTMFPSYLQHLLLDHHPASRVTEVIPFKNQQLDPVYL